jgi:hypothetical protein
VTPRKDRPQRVLVHFRGITYEMDILACERALVKRQVGGVRHPALEERLQVKRQARSESGAGCSGPGSRMPAMPWPSRG